MVEGVHFTHTYSKKLQIWTEYSTLIFENLKPVEKFKNHCSVAGSIFESHPPNFENQYNFWRCSNDTQIIFLISLLVSDFQRSVWSVPSISLAVPCLVFDETFYNVPLYFLWIRWSTPSFHNFIFNKKGQGTYLISSVKTRCTVNHGNIRTSFNHFFFYLRTFSSVFYLFLSKAIKTNFFHLLLLLS